MAEFKIKKRRPEDWSVSENAAVVTLGFDLTGRGLISWDMAESKNLLLAGYGVRQTEWELASIIQHAKHYGIPVYGQVFSSYVSDFPKNTFKDLTADRRDAQRMLTELSESSDQHLLIITALNNLIAPTYIPEAEQAAELQRHAELIAALRAELANRAAHVVVVTSRLHEEVALPSALLEDFRTYVLTSKIFARDLEHLLREDQNEKQISDLIRKMNAGNSVLVGSKVQEFENFRTTLR